MIHHRSKIQIYNKISQIGSQSQNKNVERIFSFLDEYRVTKRIIIIIGIRLHPNSKYHVCNCVIQFHLDWFVFVWIRLHGKHFPKDLAFSTKKDKTPHHSRLHFNAMLKYINASCKGIGICNMQLHQWRFKRCCVH